MNHDIECRGKRIDTGEWVYGFYLHCFDQNSDYILTGKIKNYQVDLTHPYIMTEGFEWFAIDYKTVSKFTGLLDRKGNKIFGDDIVLYKGIRCLVRWDKDKAGFFIGNDRYWMMNDISIEVIGNIHDNATLLED